MRRKLLLLLIWILGVLLLLNGLQSYLGISDAEMHERTHLGA